MEVSFEDLLVDGKLSDALQFRSDQIEELARSYRADCEAAKLASGAAAAIGLMLSASPLIAITAGMAGLGFAYCVWRDWQITNRFNPIPGYRRNVLAAAAGMAGAHQVDDEDDPLEDILPWLPPVLAHEYELLQVSEAAVVQCLNQIDGDRRKHAYSYLLRQTRLRNILKVPPLQEVREAIALPPATDTPAEETKEPKAIEPATELASGSETTQEPEVQWDEDLPIEEIAEAEKGMQKTTEELPEWMDELLEYPAILIHGPQGSGKTTLATWLINKRKERGHTIEILDPHRSFGQWEGFSVYGEGMNYDAIDNRLIAFSNLLKSRYLQRAQKPKFNPRPITYGVEEFTNWAKRCRYSSDFFESALSDTRKVNMGVVFVSHGRTLTNLGGSKGFAGTRDNSLLEIELFAKVDPKTKKAFPTGKGKLTLPGTQTIDITIPNLILDSSIPGNEPSSDPSSAVQTAEPTELRERTKNEPEPEPNSELKQNSDEIDPKSEIITPEERGLVIETLRSGERTINGIILKVWGVKQGGSNSYKSARIKLDKILNDIGEDLK